MDDAETNNQGKTGTSSKKVLFCTCCCSIIGLVVLIGILVTSIYISEYYADTLQDPSTENSDNSDDVPANLELVHFLNSMPPDYSITAEEEVDANNQISQQFDQNDLVEVTTMLDELKIKYAEGYFVILTQSLSRPSEFKTWYDIKGLGGFSNTDIILHEMTHTGGLYNCTYFIEDKCITIENRWQLSEQLFTGDKLLNYITDTNHIDETYLAEDKHTIIVTLDEVNAYIKSVRFDRAYDSYSSNPETLSRQMYYLTLHLKYAKEEEPEDWNALVENKGFAFTLMRLTAMAEAELKAADEEDRFSYNATVNMRLYERNHEYLDEYLNAAGVSEFNDSDVTYDELQQQGVTFGLVPM